MPKRNIRLAILTDVFAPWSTGGRESRFSELLPRLANEGLDITVYTMRWWNVLPPKRVIGRGSIRLQAICAPRPLYKNGRRSLFQGVVFSFASLRLLLQDFDVLETDSIPFFHLPTVWLVSKIRRRPLIVVWHEVWGLMYWKEYLGTFGALGHWFEKTSVHIGDAVVAVSRRSLQQLSDLGAKGDRLFFAENAVRRFPQVDDAPSPELLFVGRLIAHKRPDLVINVLSQLGDLNLRLCIVGTGPMKTELERQISRAGLADQVKFIESVTDEVLASLLFNALILVAPSEREGFGLVVAEALSLGTPVITVDAPANAARDIVIDGVSGHVCVAGDAADIACAVRDLLANPLGRKDVVRAWESLGTPRSYESMAQELLRLYSLVANRD
jgi:glycosyltransferase involved in cell wall biosynthesis